MVGVLEMMIPVNGIATMLCYECGYDFGWAKTGFHGSRDMPVLCTDCAMNIDALLKYDKQMKGFHDANTD